MLRIWSEHLPLADARRADVVDLLTSGPVHPFFAVTPEADLDELSHTLRVLTDAGLEPGVWPLLRDEDGYWPSERNSQAYFARAHAILDHLEEQGARAAWMAVDLEPPLTQIDRLRHAVEPQRKLVLKLARENYDPPRYQESLAAFRAGADAVRARGTRTLAVTVPMAAHDLRDDVPLWQDLFEAPWHGVGWDRAGIMAYGSMVAGSPRRLLSIPDARAIHYRLFLHLARAYGERAHASIGVTGIGKLGDEPVYTRPEELGLDASAARAAGVEDLAIFCLEGLVGREDAGAWIDAVAKAPPITPPMTVRARAARLGTAGVRMAVKKALGAGT